MSVRSILAHLRGASAGAVRGGGARARGAFLVAVLAVTGPVCAVAIDPSGAPGSAAADASSEAPTEASLESRTGSATGSPEERFERANAAFAAGRYEEAIEGFESLAAAHGYSPALLFDLGNSYLRAGRIGPAVLAYERALVLDPRDADVRANLRQARQAAELTEPEPGAWERTADLLSSSGWAYLLSAGLYLTCLALALLRLLRTPDPRRSPWRRALRAAAVLGVIVIAAAGAFLGTRLSQLDRGIVVADQPTLRVAPYESATVMAELTPGETVEIEREHDGFALIRTVKGRSGWMTPGSVDRIVPKAGASAPTDAAPPPDSDGDSDEAVRADAGTEVKR